QHRQLVLTDRSELSQGKEFGVFTANTWRLADLGAKHAFLRAGLGWGGMPVDAIKRDLANRSLVKIRLEDVPEGHLVMAMAAVFLALAASRFFCFATKSSAPPKQAA